MNVVLKNTITNYVSVFLRLLQGILLTRWTYQYLGKADYGFWALLWSFFIYVLLLDFGCGKAVQKCSATNLYEHDPEGFNRVFSAVFTMQSLVGLLLVPATIVLGMYLDVLTGLTDPEHLKYCRTALYLFGFGTVIAFPTGLFPEMLTGLNRIYLRNYIQVFTKIIEIAGVLILFLLGGRLLTLVIFTITLNIINNSVLGIACYKLVPTLRIRLIPDIKTIKELFSFSVYAYLIMLSNIVMMRSDRIVLGIFSGLSSVGAYQLGSRLPDIVTQMTSQYQESLAPISASLRAKDAMHKLRKVIFNALRFCSFSAAGGCVMAMLLAPELMGLLLGARGPLEVRICILLLISVFVTVSFRSVSAKVQLMAGHHKFLATVLMIEAVFNVTLSIFLTRKIGATGVVYGTLFPNLAVSFLVMTPWLVRFVRINIWKVMTEVWLKPLLAVAPAAIFIAVFKYYILQNAHDYTIILICGLGGGLIYLLLSGLLMLTPAERVVWERKIRKMRKRIWN